MGTINKSSKLIILHGWTTSTEKWNPFVKELKKNGFNVKILPIPGLTQKIDRAWDLDNYVEWLKKIIGTKKVILLGHSNGGRIALAFTVKYPKNVSKLILIDSAGIYHNELPLRIKRGLFKGFTFIGKKITKNEGLRNILYKFTLESDYKNADKIQRQIMVNFISQDLTPTLSKIKVPTLIIWGQKDTITKLSDGKLMHKLIKNSKLEIINNSKHSPHYSHPKEVAKLIYEYL